MGYFMLIWYGSVLSLVVMYPSHLKKYILVLKTQMSDVGDRQIDFVIMVLLSLHIQTYDLMVTSKRSSFLSFTTT